MTNGALLSASTLGHGDAGSVTITAHDIFSLDGVGRNGLPTGVGSQVTPKAVGNGGNVNVIAGALSVTNGAQLNTSTFGRGNAGRVTIEASRTLSFDGVSSNGFSSGVGSTVEATGVGRGGGINITAGSLSVTNGAFLSASTGSQGDGGNITLNTNTLEAVNGGQVLTTTSSSGKAGDITINVTNSVTLSGSDRTYNARLAQFGEDRVSGAGPASGLFANTFPDSTGNGGTISIDPTKLTLTDGASVAVNSLGKGNAGNLNIQAGTVTLDRGSSITAATASGEGGIINLHSQDLLLTRHGSKISALAQGTANGGNININTPFLVVVPTEQSNIIANAFKGRGGNIRITASGVFGIQPSQRQIPQSYINASSQLGINGTVQITTLDINPSQGLVTLPVVPVNVTGLIAQGCPAAVGPRASKFVITGRGGLPPNPSDTLSSDTVWTDLRPHTRRTRSSSVTQKTTPLTNFTTEPLVEATGWVTNAKGEVVLTASAPTVTPDIPWLRPTTCHLQ